jgi:hypothetical protein
VGQILAGTNKGIEVASLGSLARLVFGFVGRITHAKCEARYGKMTWGWEHERNYGG